MPGQRLPEALPRSHYFLTVSRGATMRTYAARSVMVHALAAVLPLVLLAGLGSTLYLAFHDDLMAGLMVHQSEMQYAYEDRIEALRLDLERQSTRGRAEQRTLDARVHDLFAREATLETRAALVADLAAQTVTQPGTRLARGLPLPPEITGGSPALPAAALGYAPDKPRPLTEPASGGPKAASAAHAEDHAALMDDPAFALGDRLATADRSLDRIEKDQVGTLSQAVAAVRNRVARIRNLIETAGLSPDRYLAKVGPATQPAMGGPFVPLPSGADGQFGRAMTDLRVATASAAQFDNALTRLPIATPLPGHPDISSPFGARLDPFLGRPALHTGVDFREGYGVAIRATAAGRVALAGTAGGYGNMVEVDHGAGVATRYAHMGQIAIAEGQSVTRGTVLGYVGATGRATGPHLHYEVRVDGEPIDPMRFIETADRADMAGLLAAR
jgi:murein DD-endopeptidase MepM/ murein hydrolase activator NlpD